MFKKILLLSSALLGSAFADDSFVNIDSKVAYPIMLSTSENSNYLKVSVTGKHIPQRRDHARSPINLSLVIDRSGSMGGEKIEQARKAALLAVDLLSESDTLSVIGYDTDVEVIVPATKLTDKQTVKNNIQREIHASGNTALYAGVKKGIEETKKFFANNNVNRVILLSDGQANRGPSSIREIGELGKQAAQQGITVSTVGLGLGYNEDLMTVLAGYSDGNHAFVENANSLPDVFKSEFNDVVNVVAQNVRVTIEVENGKPVRLLGREGKINGNSVNVLLNSIYAAQEKYVLLEVAPTEQPAKGEQVMANIRVDYNEQQTEKSRTNNQSVKVLYTDSQALVDKAINEDVLAEFYIQKSNLANELAIEALDAGDQQKANTILMKAAREVKVEMSSLSSPEAQDKVMTTYNELNTSAQETLAAPVTKVRKSIKSKSYNSKRQKQ